MKTQTHLFTVVLALAGLLAFSAGALAARPPGAGNGGGNGGGGGGDMAPPDYGDLIILYRDADGVPIPSDEVQVPDPETGLLVDGGLCWQPIAFNVDDETACPAECVVASAPEGADVVAVNQYSCGVEVGCSGCTQEVDFGRINAARSPVTVFDSQLADVIVNLATADCTALDPAGRMIAIRAAEALDDNLLSTIDSPLQNLAIYRQLMLTGSIGVALPQDADPIDTAARGLGVGSDKSGEVNVDLVAYLNQIMGLTDPATTTILDPKLCETYREEVQGVIQLVEKCFLNYGNVPPSGLAYRYRRAQNFEALPSPPYIDDPMGSEDMGGWFEYLAVLDGTVPSFTIAYGPILDTVFDTDLNLDEGNIGGFARAADDTRAVISYMHTWQVPVGYETAVPCTVDPGLMAYDVLISEMSGLQVPVQMVDGGDGREFTVTVTNASGSANPASGTVTVTAVAESGGNINGSPWTFEFNDLGVGSTFSPGPVPFQIDLGQTTKINWTAVAAAPNDVNLSNNTAYATTNVRVTGSGRGGGGGPGGGGGAR